MDTAVLKAHTRRRSIDFDVLTPYLNGTFKDTDRLAYSFLDSFLLFIFFFFFFWIGHISLQRTETKRRAGGQCVDQYMNYAVSIFESFFS